jgi:hypothetical protein
VNGQTVAEVATIGGRQRWCIENQGFNMQKNSGLQLEHAYSEGEHWAVYYYLLQLAQQQGKSSAVALFGSLKNRAERLLESLRNRVWPEEAYVRVRIRFDSS